MNSNRTLCVGILFDEITPLECSISRISASMIVLVSIFAILFNIRFIYWSSYHRSVRTRNYALMISMIVSSMSVIMVITPSIFIQCFSCYRWCSPFYCRLEGFVNYLNGCVNMFMLMMISIIRYRTVIHSNIKKRYLEQHSLIAVLICWLGGLIFALPPLFNWNAYVPEGIGFHCGLNWFDRSISSRLYFILAFSFIYFIPLIILFVINIYVYCVIRRLLYGVTRSNIRLNETDQKQQLTSSTPSCCSSTTTYSGEQHECIVSTHSLDESPRSLLQLNELKRLNRLKADRRFALATTFLISEYLFSWTPYALVALFYLCDVQFISHQSISMTVCAFTAKIAMILNPFIYILTVQINQMKTMFYCRQCSCSYCTTKKNTIDL